MHSRLSSSWSSPSPPPPPDFSLLCLIASIAYIIEGSIEDWSGIYLVLDLGARPIVGTLGFVTFQIVTTAGTLSMDRIITKYGISRVLLLELAGVIASLGLLLAAMAPACDKPYSLPAAICGFGLCGMGLCTVAPIIMHLAGTAIQGMVPSEAIAIVATVSYTGIVIGPAFIAGMYAAFGDLRWAFLADGVLALAITALTFFCFSTRMLSNESKTMKHKSHQNH